MMLMPCPWCGPRNVSEFRYVGEARERPDPATATAGEWRDYLYLNANPRGPVVETWLHRMGCRQFFRAERDTATNTVLAVQAAGNPAPAGPAGGGPFTAPAPGGPAGGSATPRSAGSGR
jgi:sarcosine oxidase subunit delta